MPRVPHVLAALVLASALAGCGTFGLFGKPDLTALEVAGRYQFTEYRIDPVSDAVRDYDLKGNVLPEDASLLLREDGTVALQTLRGDRVDETLSEGSFTLSGRSVVVRFFDGGAVDRYFLPTEIRFEGGNQSLAAELFREGLNLERISNDYRGITRADAQLRIRLRRLG